MIRLHEGDPAEAVVGVINLPGLAEPGVVVIDVVQGQ